MKNAVARGIELIGGIAQFAAAGEKILLKPNLLAADPPEKCVTTHPAVFKAAAELFKETGAFIKYGDSPGFNKPETAAAKSGIAQAADETGIEMADFVNGEEIVFAEGIQNKKFVIAKGVLEADGIISLPKLKTHAFTKMTGSIKNQFGCVPGFLKGEYHVKLPGTDLFSKMLVDLNNFLKPRLFIMDGVMAMEGNGPRGGMPRLMGVIIISKDPVALDAVVCRMIGIAPENVFMLKHGHTAGLGTYLDSEIEILGDNIEQFIKSDYQVIHKESSKPSRITPLIDKIFVNKPFIDYAKCVKCGVCVKMCPVKPKALNWLNDDTNIPPVYDYSRCIKCFCCQELCPENAIYVKKPFIRKILL